MIVQNDELTLKLDIYEGPLDLLLHLIRRNEVDINDIPVSLITAQYLEYVELIETLNLDLAGDFLIMAATLTHIKSKLLLPSDPESREEDPRLELVRPLLEHAAFQAAAEALGGLPQLERDVFLRGGKGADTLDAALPPGEDSAPVAKTSAYELVKAWGEILDRRRSAGLSLNFMMETVTIGEKLQKIRLFLAGAKTAHFGDLARERGNSFELALNFLAVLELARVGFLRLWQDIEVDRTGPRLFLADPRAKESAGALDYR
ncbi:MAG: segregation/condensation protein A [Deltaproteobacteria bacterium]|jgi:segregation and condensation protein A|nr:segregation/condensation protein A [Deltaproteobacteria bacterium]